MRIVVALGGNALLMRGERADATVQLHHVEAAARALAPLAAEHELVVCHGNGPQIGLLALESEADPSLTRPYPLDTLGAETQGMIGYWLAQSLRNAGVRKPVLAVVTQTVVDKTDPAFGSPTKFIGPIYDRAQVDELAEQNSWTMSADGSHWRRVVPSPEPVRLVEQESIEQLVSSGTVVVCAGGGGAPVVDNGQLHGVEAVVDKDLTSAELAIALKADRLLLLTDVPAVMTDFGLPDAEPLRHLAVEELEQLTFPAGSMGPKIEACRRFVAASGSTAAIGALTDAEAILQGAAGTTIGPVKIAETQEMRL
ncbi:carbamate kinase [Lentzea kentuckyensis]|uniref:carbamate kinase n=1 Tax=Lentzea kentuckyensis TaxID=360086 RepID=UPI000A3D0A02|nr:carbamate kinase [Lentzea kentuckyensis]